jgi:CheY-like chemotaxis protein
MKPRAQEKGISFELDTKEDFSQQQLIGDPTKLKQILINLTSNAMKFTRQGFIRISVGRSPTKNDSLMFSVTDSGSGIPASKQHLIFQKFSQADSSISRRFGGTGLGLAITKSLTELMGGQIWFKSQENVGTTFYFTLPYHEAAVQPFLTPPSAVLVGEILKPTLVPVSPKSETEKKIKILLADDTADNRILFNHYLKDKDYEIIEAENGLEAVDKIKSDKFDIVFMDVQMPELDGYGATEEIRHWEDQQHKPHIPIIALTAHALSEDRQKSLRAGCDDHITKPFKKDALLSVINKYTHQQQL